MRLFGALNYRCGHVFGFPSFFSLVLCERRHTRFQENASIPARVYACNRSPGSCTRLCAVLHLCEGQWGSRAAWLGSSRTSQFRWVGSLGVEVAGPRLSRGSRGGVRCARLGGGARVARDERGLSAQIFKRRKKAIRAVERTPGWVEGAFADSPKT